MMKKKTRSCKNGGVETKKQSLRDAGPFSVQVGACKILVVRVQGVGKCNKKDTFKLIPKLEIQEMGAISGFQQSDQAMNCLTFISKEVGWSLYRLDKLIIVEWVRFLSVGTQGLSIHYMEL